ncbi:probable KEX2 - endoproteinase of late golgi compartment [Melanopsichium pennsylvanicum]|uniref:Probable KEX2 - endoproteinase of late golgi compartment n=2 Tax=Melanopsichium pennsylvanicum TaxID=63383 RepID=A0AAJ5C4U1_9BASI|nr:probable KEX2-endoproteinase of late golgi compartment [Melanopsichium pennsylvanicum 4]SNX83864.1 probable KEX2 - endoproteinase of late golgi compartment [Melanopsichium pennsylvanicum]
MKLSTSLSLLLSGILTVASAHPDVDSNASLAVRSCSDVDAGQTSQLHRRNHNAWTHQKRTVPLPAKRSYHTHHYYVVEMHSRAGKLVDPRDVAETLGAEFVEQAGELKNHWLVRSEKPIPELTQVYEKRDASSASEFTSSAVIARPDLPEHQDPVLQRWSHIRRSARQPGFSTKHGLSKRAHAAALSIRAVERQQVRKRHKRNVIYDPAQMPHLYPEPRDPVPAPDDWPFHVRSVDPSPRPPILPTAKTAEMMSKFDIKDPIFTDQWHLANNKKLGNDLNVTAVWDQEILGKGVTVCLIDDGLDMHSPDLKDNFYAPGSYDFNSHTELPEPRESDDQHGTRCAGEIAAVKNDVCGVGVAYKAKVSGVRILSGPISDVDEAASLNYAYQENDIYSCSWGPPDDGRSMDAPRGLIAKAMLNGVQNGRDGKGSIFVFAGGNGGASDDQCNFDGYTNSIYSMTIAAVDREGQHPWYSEMCSAIIATSWSSGSGDHIHTTDVAWNGLNRCTASHGGTSAAAPLAAGVIALGLSIRPELTWRDVQHIAVRSAIKFNPEDPDWQQTQAGRHFNHKYGYGLIDAYQFVEETKRHKLVNPQAWYESPNITIPATETLITESGTESSFLITEDQLKEANLASIEHVTVRVWITHQRRGDVNVELISPHGTKSALARSRRYDDAMTGFPGWSFMTLKHWDEDAVGEWKLRVFDPAHPNKVGNIYAWSMSLWGASIDASKAVAWNFPQDSVEYYESLAAAPETTVIKLPPNFTPTQSAKLKKPTDHLPENHGQQGGESHVDFTNHNGSVPIGGDGVGVVQPEADTGYISGIKNNSTWIMVVGGLVVIFTASLAAFFLMRKRRGRGVRGGVIGNVDVRGGYESLAADEEVAMGEMDNATQRGEKSRRTKELYDAFADGGSDDDDLDDEDGKGSSDTGGGAGGIRGEVRGLLGNRGARGEDEPYRDDIEDDENVDQRFALEAEEEVEEEQKQQQGTSSASSSRSCGDDGSWQDAAEGRDLIAGLSQK